MTPPAPYYRRLLRPDLHGLLAVFGGAVFVLAAAAFARGGPAPALAVLLVVAVGLALRYTGAPVVLFLVLLWLQAFPLGLPTGFESPAPLRGSAFRLIDGLVGVALLVYLAAQYRLYVLTDRAVPDERPAKSRATGDPPLRPGTVGDAELVRLVAAAGLAALVGQVLWFLLTELELRYDELPPVRFRGPRSDNDLLSRLGLLLGGGALLVIAARVGFGLWRQARYTADEGRLLLLDTGWQEVRREAARQETWRVWPRRPRPRSRPASAVGRAFLALLVLLLAMVGFAAGVWALRRMNL